MKDVEENAEVYISGMLTILELGYTEKPKERGQRKVGCGTDI
jgi:hypothetical protein